MNFVSGIDYVTLFDVGYNHWGAWAGKARGAVGFVLTFFLSFLCQDKKEKRIQISRNFPSEIFGYPSYGKLGILESLFFYLLFGIAPKSNKKG